MKHLASILAFVFNLMLLICAMPSTGLGQLTSGTELIEAHEYHPFYKISNLRKENEGFFEKYVFELELTREGNAPKNFGLHRLHVMGRTKAGDKKLVTSMDFSSDGKPGSVEIKSSLPDDEPVEVYLIVESPIGSYFRRLLVSNVLQLGTPDSPVTARPMTEAESDEFDQKMAKIEQQAAAVKLREEQQAKHKLELERLASLPPPSEVPAGHTRADINTYLVPGTPVMYGHLDQWMPAEVVVKDGDFITVCPPGSQKVIRFKDPAWVAIKDEVLVEVENNPKAYQSNLLFLPGGTLVLRDAVAAKGQKITKAMPLCYESGGSWREARFVSANANFAWLLRDGNSSFEQISVDKLAVRLKTLEEAKDASKKKEWSENLRVSLNKAKREQTEINRRQAEFFGFRSPSRRPSSGSTPPPKPSKTTVINSPLRTWKDRSGQFEIRAKLVEKTSTKVTLEREDKQRITVEIASLSADDKKFIREN